jgi:peptidyl-dipeptidase Dcp
MFRVQLFSLILLILSTSSMSAETRQLAMKSVDAESNPFFETWDTPFGVPPFSKIKTKHFEPAFQATMKMHSAEILALENSPAAPTFENTIEALDRSGAYLGRVARVFYGLLSARTDDELNAIAQKVSPMLTRHSGDILQGQQLFNRIKTVYDKRDKLGLNKEQQVLLEETYQEFVLAGAALNNDERAELSNINESLSLLTVQFGQNILGENNRFELHITDEAQLSGLPARVIEGGAAAAKEAGKDKGWVFTIHKPSLLPFLQYSQQRDLREKMFKGYINQGANGGDLDNKELIKKILKLRTRKAQILGFKTYGDLALSRRVAGNPANVFELLHKLWTPALAVAKEEAKEFQAMIDKEGKGFKLAAWDWWYYAEQVRNQRFNLDENELRPYFQMEKVMDGAFDVANRLYGLKFVLRTDIPTYHEDVRAFEVLEADGSHLGILYTDFFPRASKRGGAWCGSYRDPQKQGGKKIYPVVTIVGNFSKPIGDKPALLSLEETSTLFHEFGHALHTLLNDTTYLKTGEAVRVDFVELPSQLMENWATAPEVLRMYAKHYKTGEVIPDELIEKLERVGTFNQGFATVEYLAASLLDMAWHTEVIGEAVDVDKFEDETLGKLGMPKEIVSRYRSPYFRHIFASSYYASGYYSYIWAAVLDADAFEAFKEHGLFDKETAKAFRDHVLSRGGAGDQMEMYRKFRGQEPKIEPLLIRRGLMTKPAPVTP